MTKVIGFIAASAIGFAAGYVLISNHLHREYGQQINQLRSEWQAEKEELEARLASAANAAAESPTTLSAPGAAAAGGTNIALPAVANIATAPSLRPAREILDQLKSLKHKGAPVTPQSRREMVRLLDDLARSGPAALPAIREFLASNEGVDLGPGGKGNKGGLATGSLRSELFKVAQEIGGPEGEKLLADSLRGATSRDELLQLARSLEEMAPGKYKDAAVALAQAQLNANEAQGKGTKPLYELLAMYGDKSYVEQARAQLIQPGGNLNKEALDYLQTSLKQENLPLLKELLQNPQFGDAKQKEEVMKMVAELAGTDQQANQFWYESALNPNYTDKMREKAIKELEARGFQDRNNPTPADLQLAQARLQLLEALRPQVQDPTQLATLDQTRARLTIMMDPNLRQALLAQPKAPKMK